MGYMLVPMQQAHTMVLYLDSNILILTEETYNFGDNSNLGVDLPGKGPIKLVAFPYALAVAVGYRCKGKG